MAMFYSNSSSPKFVLEEDGLTLLALKSYEGDKANIVARFPRRYFLENPMNESELQEVMYKYTKGKKVYIQKEIKYLFGKY